MNEENGRTALQCSSDGLVPRNYLGSLFKMQILIQYVRSRLTFCLSGALSRDQMP